MAIESAKNVAMQPESHLSRNSKVASTGSECKRSAIRRKGGKQSNHRVCEKSLLTGYEPEGLNLSWSDEKDSISIKTKSTNLWSLNQKIKMQRNDYAKSSDKQ